MPFTNSSGNPNTPYLGFVSNRAIAVTNGNTSFKYMMSRAAMIARDNIYQCKIVLPAWAVAAEIAQGNMTYTASIEYPANTFTQVTFSGAASVTVASGLQVFSDFVQLATPIPSGATFWIRVWQNGASGILFNGSSYPAAGDGWVYSATTLTDSTMVSGTAWATGSTPAPLIPLAVIGWTKKPSFLILGDSIAAALGSGVNTDTVDATLDIGSVCRSIGGTFGYANMAEAGEKAQDFIAHGANRLQLLPYCTHVIVEYGVNDISAGTSLATIKSYLQQIHNIILSQGKYSYQTTITPRTASSDSWATLGNQSAVTNFPLTGAGIRDQLNSYILANGFGITGTFDLAAQMQTSTDYWKSPGYTADGTHPTNAGYLAIKNSGVINPALFGR